MFHSTRCSIYLYFYTSFNHFSPLPLTLCVEVSEFAFSFCFLCEGIFTSSSILPSLWCHNLDSVSCMGWEAALAADVEHMPLMIHTVCGRSAAAAELGAFTSDLNRTPPPFLVCVMFCLVCFFFLSTKGKFKRNLVYALFSLSDGSS